MLRDNIMGGFDKFEDGARKPGSAERCCSVFSVAGGATLALYVVIFVQLTTVQSDWSRLEGHWSHDWTWWEYFILWGRCGTSLLSIPVMGYALRTLGFVAGWGCEGGPCSPAVEKCGPKLCKPDGWSLAKPQQPDAQKAALTLAFRMMMLSLFFSVLMTLSFWCVRMRMLVLPLVLLVVLLLSC